MALSLGDIFGLYGNSVATQKFGPDWREKLAMERANLAAKNADIAQTQAQTKNLGLVGEKEQFSLDAARSERKAVEDLVAQGKLPTSSLTALDLMHKQEAEKRAAAEETRKQAEEGRKQQAFPLTLDEERAKIANEKGKFAHEEKIANIRAEHTGTGGLALAVDPTTGNVIYAPKTTIGHPGGPLAKPTLQEKQDLAQSNSVQGTVARMKELASNPSLTSGVISGNISRAQKRIMGPSGPDDIDNEFDQLGKEAIDLVYKKSGKQINHQEMQIMQSLIPSRGKENVPEQIRVFEDYVGRVLNKYTNGSQAAAPSAPGAGGLRVISIKKVQ